MPTLLPGYSYDIFISYRQKDNKGERWVTEFVHALREELEATLKEDISIYFDENPHDGLLESHHVDKSLEGKIKCLILIPILSQTYCDPKAFAWQQEFCAFNKLAGSDSFGRDVRVSNGNVASRILPVRIHDLDEADKALLSSEIGGPVRSIDFIYRSPGVNRPLRSNEEHPDDNLNYTIYRDQINKVANAVKDLVIGLTGVGQNESAAANRTSNSATPRPASRQRKVKGLGSGDFSRGRGYLVPLLAGMTLVFVSFAGWVWVKWPDETKLGEVSSSVIRASIDVSSNPIEFIGGSSLGIGRRAISIDPAGKQIAFVGKSENTTRICLRAINDFRLTEVPHTDGAYHPVLSRDGVEVIFFEGNNLRSISTNGKGLELLAERPDLWDATYGNGNEVYCSFNQGSQLERFGDDSKLVSADTSRGYKYRSIEYIPGTSYLLFSGIGIGVHDLKTGVEKKFPVLGTSARYVPTGHIVFIAGSALMAVAFDLNSLSVTSSPVELISGLRIEQTGAGQFDFSDNGTLVYALGNDARDGAFIFHDLRTGKTDSLGFPVEQYQQFSLSPDGKRIAVGERHTGWDIFIYEIGSRKVTRLTRDGQGARPVWHPDGKRLFFSNAMGSYIVQPDNDAEPQLFMKRATVTSVSLDGNIVVLSRGGSLFTRTMSDTTLTLVSDHKSFGSISPNGKFITYTSVEAGASHVYLQPVPATGKRWQVSLAGGSEESRWSRDGKNIYYRCGQRWYRSSITLEPEIQIAPPELMLEGNYVNVGGFSYEVSAAGDKMLLIKGLPEKPSNQIQIVYGWFEELKRLVPPTR